MLCTLLKKMKRSAFHSAAKQEGVHAHGCKKRLESGERCRCCGSVQVDSAAVPLVRGDADKRQLQEFRSQKEQVKAWFREFSDGQKSLVLEDLLDLCDLPQMHFLSLKLEESLHIHCPRSCTDPLSLLPDSVALYIFAHLDPVSLARCSRVCWSWHRLSGDPSLWRSLCRRSPYRLSLEAERRQLHNNLLVDGSVCWRRVFAERYKLRRNWLMGRCAVRSFEGHTEGISCVQFDDTRIVSGSWDTSIKVWNIRTNTPWAVQTLSGHSGMVRCLHLDGNRLVSGSADKTIKVWDLSRQHNWSSIACKVTMVGHTDAVRCLQVDSEKVISGSYDCCLKIWDIRNGECLKTLRGHSGPVLCLQFDNSKIVSGSADKTIKIWDLSGCCLRTLAGHDDAVTCLQFDTSRVISGSLDCTLKFWDFSSGACVNTIDWVASEGHTRVIRCLQADNWRLISASDDKTIKVWHIETGKRLVTLQHHTDGVTCLQFNDTQIVSGSYDKTVKLWDFNID